MRRIQADSPQIVPSGAYLVSVRPEALTRTYEELNIDVETALGQLSRASRPPSGEASS